MNPSWIVLFDWDGTLVDSLEIKIRNAGQLFAERFGVPAGRVEAAYRLHSGLPRRELFDAILADLGLPGLDEATYQALSQEFTGLNQRSLLSTGEDRLVRPDTRPALQALSRRGYPLFVSSSAELEEVRQLAGRLDLERYFEAILGSQPGFSKGVDHVNFVLDRCNARPSEIVIVGDEPADIRLAHTAGVLAVALAGTYPVERLKMEGADGVIASLGELGAWLEQ